MFCKNRPHGGAITGLSRKCGAEVHCCHPRSVCAQFRSDRTSGAGDYALTDNLTHTRTHTHTDGRTDEVQNIVSPHAFGLVETINVSFQYNNILYAFIYSLSPPGRRHEGRLCFAPRPSVCVSVRVCVCVSVCQSVCERVISGTTGPIAAKLCTHTPWMPTMNLWLKFSR